MSADHEPLLKAEMDELHQWFDRLYGKTRRATLKIYSKYNVLKSREEYILDMFFDSTSRSLPFQVPKSILEDIEMRLKIKERWVQEMQKQITGVLQ
jgi:hypothetical protein